ncbi:hypothetical protein JB92DRAFT_3097854, partial [Gautieria morchelliformis]
MPSHGRWRNPWTWEGTRVGAAGREWGTDPGTAARRRAPCTRQVPVATGPRVRGACPPHMPRTVRRPAPLRIVTPRPAVSPQRNASTLPPQAATRAYPAPPRPHKCSPRPQGKRSPGTLYYGPSCPTFSNLQMPHGEVLFESIVAGFCAARFTRRVPQVLPDAATHGPSPSCFVAFLHRLHASKRDKLTRVDRPPPSRLDLGSPVDGL